MEVELAFVIKLDIRLLISTECVIHVKMESDVPAPFSNSPYIDSLTFDYKKLILSAHLLSSGIP